MPFGWPLFWATATLSSRRPKEPAWHRKARRLRTRARTLLRTYLDGVQQPRRTIQAAAALLRRHHSGSVLPARAERALTIESQADDMAYQAWKCRPCARMCGKAAEYCGSCGQHWSAVAEGYATTTRTPPPWTREAGPQAQWPESPRARRKSPRMRPPKPAKGAGKGQKDAATKGQGKMESGKQPQAPTMMSLPSAPTGRAVTGPKLPGSAAASSSTERTQLDALTGCLLAAKDSLPAEVREHLEKMQLLDAANNTKELHRAVAAQAQARKQLLQVRMARAAYTEAWSSYVEQLSQLLQTQLREQEEQLEAYDATELQWSGTLERASGDLARLASVPNLAKEELEDMELEASEQMVEADIQTAKELEQKRHQ